MSQAGSETQEEHLNFGIDKEKIRKGFIALIVKTAYEGRPIEQTKISPVYEPLFEAVTRPTWQEQLTALAAVKPNEELTLDFLRAFGQWYVEKMSKTVPLNEISAFLSKLRRTGTMDQEAQTNKMPSTEATDGKYEAMSLKDLHQEYKRLTGRIRIFFLDSEEDERRELIAEIKEEIAKQRS